MSAHPHATGIPYTYETHTHIPTHIYIQKNFKQIVTFLEFLVINLCKDHHKELKSLRKVGLQKKICGSEDMTP